MLTIEEARQRWQGVVVPLVTLFTEDGSVDLEGTAAHVEWLIGRGAKQGNTILLVAGSGGDFPMLNLAERQAVIRSVAEANNGRLPMIAGVQSTDIRETIALCRLCEEVGVDAAQIAGPYYYDGRPGDVLAWMREVADNTRIPFAIYNNWYTGYDMPENLVDALLDLPNSIGAKWGSPDVQTYYRGIRRFMPKVAVVDNSLLPIVPHMLGCRAFISHIPNFLPEHAWQVWEQMERGDYLAAQQTHDAVMVPYSALVGRITRETIGEGIFVKAAMTAAGLRAGGSRLPSRDAAVTPDIVNGFKELLATVGTTGALAG